MMLSLWNKLVTPIRQRGAWFRGAVCAVVRLDRRRSNLVTVSQVGGGLSRRGPCSVSAPRESLAQLAKLEGACPLKNRSTILAFSTPGLAAKASCRLSIILEISMGLIKPE